MILRADGIADCNALVVLRRRHRVLNEADHGHKKVPWIKTCDVILGPDQISQAYSILRQLGSFDALVRWNMAKHPVLSLLHDFAVPIQKSGRPSMNSQEELLLCLWQLTEALAPNCVRQLSIVRDGDAPSVFCAASDLSDAVSERSEIIQTEQRQF